MMDWILEPFQYGFIQRGVIAALLVGITGAVLGVYVVLRRMSNVGHALTHSAFPGLVVAYLSGINLFVGAFIATVLTALGIGLISKNDEVYEDTAIGILPTAMFAFGVLLMSTTKSFRDLSAMLFGNILGVTDIDLFLIIGISAVVLGTLILFYKEFELFSVDPNYAQTIGINLSWVRYTLLILLALTVVTGIQAVGTILTNALLIAPVAAARLLTNRLKTMVVIACGIAVSSALSGVYLSYYFGWSSGAAIVCMCAVFFGVCWLIRTIKRNEHA
jgi:ABC-type Mn2+/Zn2+ transport system permease subunit